MAKWLVTWHLPSASLRVFDFLFLMPLTIRLLMSLVDLLVVGVNPARVVHDSSRSWAGILAVILVGLVYLRALSRMEQFDVVPNPFSKLLNRARIRDLKTYMRKMWMRISALTQTPLVRIFWFVDMWAFYDFLLLFGYISVQENELLLVFELNEWFHSCKKWDLVQVNRD